MTPLLSVQDLNAFYGQSHVLRGVTLHVNPGEVVSLIGRNGAGKTTTLKSVMGVLRSRTGQITFGGQDISRLPSNRVAAQGLAWVPEERAILSTLTVRENLELPPSRPGGWSTERIYDAFPVLRERGHHPGSKLSGGEQQMLAMVRVLRAGPKLLLLDEPSEGLAPVIVQRIGEIIDTLRQSGMAVLLVEQNLKFASHLADRHYVFVDGQIVDEVAREQVEARREDLLRYLSV
ncbi:ABC transporter ATP-binding protein [Deinococcus soli (ex Cha et al. 2016)]|uniref:Branched-chain amino acid transport system ATP-binding protein n=2 Tax=Deinococcus soli (ex Cha et al. 2016) TaxID=1309411 RepID=A0AAE3XHD1_9DEIO|nr:ABC transporter ATP-binding protein [Deinococcus soli (ex Cha et al. 2016)]MDR6220904.1 branched-chain amino acid transport system ATP-binding protein [Deinococcus soli (ex Cha et al. 2016)]MDR6330912.1 branched-chain amino acid transport system ATP-binding protein [Deinococcus soli (ex Cha et al. 2016)]MDR6754098.1 branched-chain amino acid transport system ATP-binding protein [Deinococcus soli (ex Cha et al. 2016)]